MRIAVPKETRTDENRVALSPDVVKLLIKKGFECIVEKEAGMKSYFADDAYTQAGATIVDSKEALYQQADVVVRVNAPKKEEVAMMKEGTVLISFMFAATNPELVKACATQHISALSMDAIPRISRAQKMDALSSQSNLAGYKTVLMAANALGKIFPLMMTAAGTITPAKVVIMGAGVAGLQAIATAKRLGAVVEVTDIRFETKEQVESLGGRFLKVESDHSLETEGGYAKEVSAEFLKKQHELIAKHIADADIVITTALVPGKKAPVLVTEEMVKSMRLGTVIVDMAVEQGGNCAISELNRTVVKHGVTIIGQANIPSLLPMNASELYAKNIYSLITDLADKDGFKWDMEDEITVGSLITHQGKVMKEELKINN